MKRTKLFFSVLVGTLFFFWGSDLSAQIFKNQRTIYPSGNYTSTFTIQLGSPGKGPTAGPIYGFIPAIYPQHPYAGGRAPDGIVPNSPADGKTAPDGTAPNGGMVQTEYGGGIPTNGIISNNFNRYDGRFWGRYPPFFSFGWGGHYAPSVRPIPNFNYVPKGFLDPSPMKPAEVVERAAIIEVNVPEDAIVLIDGKSTKHQGPVRVFNTPKLTPNTDFSYLVRAEWKEGEKEVIKRKKVTVRAGTRSIVDFIENY